jgi:hypothetical protein
MQTANLKITCGGRLVCDIWNKETKQMTRNVDVTDSVLFYLDSECVLDDNLKLKDVFLLIQNIDRYDVLSPMYTCSPNWLQEIVEEGLSEEGSKVDPIDNVVVHWGAELDDFLNDKDTLHFNVHINGRKDDCDERYALSLTPSCELMDCGLKLDNNFKIFDNRSNARQKLLKEEGKGTKQGKYNMECPHVLEASRRFTLNDILYGIFWELSFMGGPIERTKQCDDLMETIKKVKDGTVKSIPAEEVFASLKKKFGEDA